MSFTEQANMFEKNREYMDKYFASKKSNIPLPVKKAMVKIEGLSDEANEFISNKDKIRYTKWMAKTMSEDMQYRWSWVLPENVIKRQNEIDSFIEKSWLKIKTDSKWNSYVLRSEFEKVGNNALPVKKVELPMKADEWLATEAKKYNSADEFWVWLKSNEKLLMQVSNSMSDDIMKKLDEVQKLWDEKKLPQRTIDAIKNDVIEWTTDVIGSVDNKTSRTIVETVYGIKLPKTIKWTKSAMSDITYKMYSEKVKQIREQANRK